MRRLRGARTQQRCYPTLHKAWARNANRARWGWPLVPVLLADTPAAIAAREAGRLTKQRERTNKPAPAPAGCALAAHTAVLRPGCPPSFAMALDRALWYF